jgi:hypothetical protein
MQVTSDGLAVAAGILLSLAFSYGPKVSTWYARLDGTTKRLVMLGAVVVVAGGLFGLGCAGVSVFGYTVACTTAGALGLAQSVIVCAIANQTTDRMSPAIGPAADIVKAQNQAATVAAVAVAVNAIAPDSGGPKPA